MGKEIKEKIIVRNNMIIKKIIELIKSDRKRVNNYILYSENYLLIN